MPRAQVGSKPVDNEVVKEAPVVKLPPPTPEKGALSLWEVLAELAEGVPVIGKPLKFMLQRGGGRAALVIATLFTVFVAYPLYVPYIAATVLNSLVAAPAQEWYAENVRSSFRVKEEADRSASRVREEARKATKDSNSRLDYFHSVDIEMNPQDVVRRSIPVSAHQKMRIRSGRTVFVGKCDRMSPQLLGEGATLLQVKVGEHQLLRITNSESQDLRVIGRTEWTLLEAHTSDNRLMLTFEPVKEVRDLKCKDLRIRVNATIEVFKELVL
jgi:hypothetical protein